VVCGEWRIAFQVEFEEQLAQQQPRPGVRMDEQGVLANPA
jgi:hypothetical protein